MRSSDAQQHPQLYTSEAVGILDWVLGVKRSDVADLDTCKRPTRVIYINIKIQKSQNYKMSKSYKI